MMWFVLKLLLISQIVSANFLILPNDAEDILCERAACSDSQMCVVDKVKGKAECVDQKQLETYVKKNGVPTKTHNADKNQCTRSELHQMGGRLLKWFADVHHETAGTDRVLKSHTIQCRQEVAWMFQQWDGNNNGHLSKRELKPLERGDSEKCVEQFIDMCDDIIVDGKISIDEWCDCFSFADNLRHEPPCHKAKHDIDPHLLGAFLPRCDLEGFYQPEQCHSGQCWCVDKYGREFDQSRVDKQLPDCGQYASDLSEEDLQDLHARF
ncbi:unnamed protein product [Caenorhabditis angaria]|uniref:Thyroglobulin type-1 domain-containing protein n=1 Tax=Caenorhabditis angaria TaxID=860376 RepID=A0A9P1N3V5_9PELO|nr:unnamed protein product [Caenorhabditis angaria]